MKLKIFQSAGVWAMARMRQHSFVRALSRTMTMILPFALFGSIARVILVNVFYEGGFINNIFYLDRWVPDNVMTWGGAIFTTLSAISIGLMGLVASYGMAYYSARLFKKDDLMAGITGVMTLVISAYQIQRIARGGLQLTFNYDMLGYNMILYDLLIGYVVGLFFKFFGPDYTPDLGYEHTRDFRKQTYAAGFPITFSLILGMLICILINGFDLTDWWTNLQNTLMSFANQPHNFGLMILMSIFSAFLEWIGFSSPFNIANINDSSAIAANLNYALLHGSTWHIPYKYLWSSIYPSYSRFGGTGLILPLLVALLIASQRSDDVKLAKWTIGPSIFNSNYAVMVGLPVILNPLYLIPYIFLPIFNMLIAAGAIALSLVPSSAYPVPLGTPGVLVAFISTNGSWQALLLSLLLFLIDVLAYLPFVKLASAVSHRVRELQAKEEAPVNEK